MNSELKINLPALGLGALLFGFGLYSYFFKNSPASQNIVLVNGTLKSIEYHGKGFVSIEINEKENEFEIKPYVSSYFRFDDFKSAHKPGDKIAIAMDRNDIKELGNASKIEIISLSSGINNYLTLKDYNEGLSKDKNFVWGFVVCGLYLFYLGFKNESIESRKNAIIIGAIFILSIIVGKLI
jgi:hypothetical protein